MKKIGLIDKVRRFRQKNVSVSQYKVITDVGNGFYSYNGNLYQSDIIRAAIRPKTQSIGKAVAKHVRKGLDGIKVNPDIYMKVLLEEPNEYMTGQMLQEKLAVQLELNNNAFAYIQRNSDGYANAIYPITSSNVEAIQGEAGDMFLKFTLKNGKIVIFRYADIIHLRKDFNNNEIFGDSPAEALVPLMEIVSTTDQGIVKAVQNSNVIKWLLKFHQTLKPEDITKNVKTFVDNFLSVNSESGGAAAVDAKMDAQQVTPSDYVPNAAQIDRTVKRIYSFFNVNEKIVQGSYDENEWISFYETSIEPIVIQLSNEFTRKLFSRRERGFGNKIMFEASNLAFASMQTKLNLVQYVDRGIMTPNEVRDILSLAPIEGGDTPVRRLDTAPVGSGKEVNE